MLASIFSATREWFNSASSIPHGSWWPRGICHLPVVDFPPTVSRIVFAGFPRSTACFRLQVCFELYNGFLYWPPSNRSGKVDGSRCFLPCRCDCTCYQYCSWYMRSWPAKHWHKLCRSLISLRAYGLSTAEQYTASDNPSLVTCTSTLSHLYITYSGLQMIQMPAQGHFLSQCTNSTYYVHEPLLFWPLHCFRNRSIPQTT